MAPRPESRGPDTYYARHPEKRIAWNERKRARYYIWVDKVNEIKLASGCVDCGYDKHPAALDFDHVLGQKLFGIGGSYGRKWELVLAEIAKCEVRCANCHRIKTSERTQRMGSDNG